MNNGVALIFDTECTSRNDDREIIEAAWLRPGVVEDLVGESDAIPQPIAAHIVAGFEKRYRPTKPIEYGAMAVHNILPRELEDCDPSATFKLPEGVEYLVGHSVDFDWEAIGKPPGIKRIDTCGIARWLWPDADSHSQSALLYKLLGPTESTRARLQSAHSALADVTNNLLLLQMILNARPEITTWSQLHAYSEACRIPRVMPIGERQGVKGMTLDEAVAYDMGFCEWCLRQDFVDAYLKTGIRQAIERYYNPPPVIESAPVEEFSDEIPF